jgi:arsenical pump membrane protein
VTTLARIAWTERSAADDRFLLILDLTSVAGTALGALLLAVPVLTAPVGRLSSPLALLVVLPPLAVALESFGWRDRVASALARTRRPLLRLLTAYATWLATSAALTLDVAAVAAASVGVAVAGNRIEERRWQLGGAILGANVGSLLLPFSNLTNMVLVSASGIGFAGYVGIAIWPQLAAAAAVGLLFALRARRALAGPADSSVALPRVLDHAGTTSASAATARAAGGVAVLGAVAAVIVGVENGNMAVPFAGSAAVLAGASVATGRVAIRTVVGSVPLAGVAVIAIASMTTGPIAAAAGWLPHPDSTLGGIVLAATVGGALAAVANNLPAAAFGAVWLAGADPASIVAFLIGTNIAALATPHGSVATILARAVGGRHGVEPAAGRYLRSGWRYALVGSVAGIVALALVAR